MIFEIGRTFTIRSRVVPGEGSSHDLIRSEDGLGFGLSFLEDIGGVKPRKHKETKVAYIILRGWAKIRTYNGKYETKRILESITVPSNTYHNIVEMSEDCIIAAFSAPAFEVDSQDVYLEE